MLALYLQYFDSESDKSLFTDIYNKYEQVILKTASYYLYNKSFCKDCVQDTFLELVKSFETFKTLSDEKQQKYLVTICKRCAIKINNKNSMETVSFDDDIAGEIATETKQDFSFSDVDSIASVILTLDDKYRVPLVMKYVDGYKISEIADFLALSETSVKQRLYRARKMIEDALGKEQKYAE